MNDQEFRSKVLRMLFLHPAVSAPFVLGFICLTLSYEEGARVFRIVGLSSLLFAALALFVRMNFLFESIVQKAFARWHQEKQKEQNKALDALDRRLALDADPKNEQVLRKFRAIYKVFIETAQSGRIREYDFLNTAERLFKSSIYYLEQSAVKFDQAMRLPAGEPRCQLMDERDKLMAEVEANAESLSRALYEINKLKSSVGTEALKELREELDQRVEFAQRVEQQVVRPLDSLRTNKCYEV